jgi:hypothetical protein
MLIVWRSNFFHYQGKKRRQCKALARLFNEDSEKKNESKSIFISHPLSARQQQDLQSEL